MLKLVHLFIFLSLTTSLIHAADIKSIGVPYIENYPKSVYASGNQNWSIAKDNKGVMYFGNAEGLLTFDGKYWQKYQMPNRQIVRSVATDQNGKIYTGGFGEFGYWAYLNNKLSYKSLTSLLPKGVKVSDEIWKIYVDRDRVIFQSFSRIFIYKNEKIEIIKAPSSFLFLHKVNNRYLIEVLDKGLFELSGSKLTYIPNSDKLGKQGILSILPYKQNGLIIGTSKNGLFTYDGQDFTPLLTPANNYLKTFQLNNGVKLLDKYYAYGTILNGLIIIDENGTVVQRINKSSGLQNNTVLSIYADNEQNLWTGLDNGIDRIELNSPLYFYFDKTGQFGTVYSSIIFKDKIYLGTNQGLFYSDWSKNSELVPFNFRLIPNSQGQVWELAILNNELICGHNNGTFKVVGDQITWISTISGGWTIKKSSSNPNYFIQGTYIGLSLYKNTPAGLKFSNKILGFGEPSRFIEQDHKGDIWVAHAYKGLYKLTLNSDYTKVNSTKYFDERNGLPGNYNINIFNLENRIVFSSDRGFYTYDELSNKFTPYDVLNKSLGSFATSNKIISAGNRKYWFIDHGKTSLVSFSEPGKIEIDSNQFSLLDGRMVQYYENISQISNAIYLISVDDGFVIYNSTLNQSIQKRKLPAVLIRRIEDITDKYFTISETGNSSSETEIPNSRNNIRISFALPYYRQAKIKFQYYLEGYSRDWSDWSIATQKDFTNLSSGTYTFKVRAKLDDTSVSDTTSFEFTILRPWYLSNLAILIYLVLVIIIVIFGKRAYETKLKRDSQKISDKLKAEQDEILRQEAEVNEKQIIKLQTEKLQAELASKNRELANSAMTLVYKNELLQKLSGEITKLKDESGKKLSEDQTRKIQKVINDGMNDERDWNLFENSFNEAHESFFKKLKAQHPDLVPNDLKLCAYLRMNMSSKEMSSLLNISLRGVEIRRYRLRKKLEVPHDKNLTEFLMEL
ncbi:ligand-binding sensor domain-containing protein [Pedobacter agri]|uniref:ligand-binding sensor domain-containing protein n=1 Tax=Pedobacter agri TaxID=454586 RepID=UPI0027892D7E|nr:triple tyrosine motif-containing protein [Pedobacter agri]MDQ1139928.1 ligand-binding sensor domain-containing protein/DNA-binding CsgD family transcriptional regulator/predicted Holliday junction resolvase-like endonuclease [Pedobacter agri]